jgi:hypothetical protein
LNLRELQVQRLARVQLFLLLSFYLRQKIIESPYLPPSIPLGLLRRSHDIAPSL